MYLLPQHTYGIDNMTGIFKWNLCLTCTTCHTFTYHTTI